MFQSICRKLLALWAPNPRPKARSAGPRRQLRFEDLEGRKLLSVNVANAVSDGSFETPVLAANSFQYAPGGAPWQFSGGAGIATDGSAFTSSNPAAPDGVQAAFLQGAGYMNQTVYLNAANYSITFMAAQRAGVAQAHYQEIEVLVDGTAAGTATPPSTSYGWYQMPTFTEATAGMHTVQFLGLNPAGGDNTAFIDEVTIAAETDTISDGSFEAPSLAAGAYQYNPTGSAWQFSAGSGVATNLSAFTSSAPTPPTAIRSPSCKPPAPSARRLTWTPATTASPLWPPSAAAPPNSIIRNSKCKSTGP